MRARRQVLATKQVKHCHVQFSILNKDPLLAATEGPEKVPEP